MDLVSANGFPFWEKTSVNGVGAFFESRAVPLIELAAEAGKQILISETGWPTGGSHVNASEATPENSVVC